MTLDFEESAIEIAQLENQKFENKYKINSLAPLDRPTFKDDIKDSPSIFRIDGFRHEDDSVITISNYQFPNFVNEAVEKSNMAAKKLNPHLSKHILLPSITGSYGKQSYAFWPRKMAISNNRFLKRAQIMAVHKKAFQWLCDVTETTKQFVEPGEELKNQYIDPLTFLIDEDFIPCSIKRIASDTLSSLESTNFRPVNILQHGDFWYENILLERHWPLSLKSYNSFFIIDWGGANIHGYPFIDQVRYLMSVGQQNSAIMHNLNLYANKCDLSTKDILSYVCTYAGHLGMNRNEFPLDRYLKLINILILRASHFTCSPSQKPQ